MTMARMILLPGREKSLLRRHSWIFSGAVAKIEGNAAPGETVLVSDCRGNALALAAYSPKSQIMGRVWSFDPSETIDRAFFRRKVSAAAAFRKDLQLDDPAGGCRLIYSESDGLPGVTADRYGSFVVLQLLSAGAAFHREDIVAALMELPGIRGVYERSDVPVCKHEGLPGFCGKLAGEDLPEEIIITENGLRFSVDPARGQKTGFYFDLRDARKTLRNFVSGKRVLNMFCYTGGFAANALAAGASFVLNCDSSRPALLQTEKNLELNGFDKARYENVCADGFDYLEKLTASGEKFDVVILDPPKLIDKKAALNRGCRAYQFLARSGYTLLNPGGVMFNFSCSGLMDPDLFTKITASAACESSCSGAFIGMLRQAADHPVNIAVPETFYLKGLISKKYL